MSVTELFRVGANYELVFVGATLSLILSSILVPLFIKLSNKFNVLDMPADGSHKTHLEPIPYLGGLSIATASLLSSSLVISFGDYSTRIETLSLVFCLGLVAMTLLGLADDLKPRGAKERLVFQAFIALVVSVFLYELDFVRIKITDIPPLNILICTLVVVSVCNFLNMFDNHDGSASGVALIILLLVLFISIKSSQILLSIFTSILVAAVVPFLFWNFPPARIYLGDSGATFLGTAIGVLLVSIEFTTLSPINSILASFCLIGILILDFSVAVLSRIRRGISPMIGDKAHTAHRLIRLSLSKFQTTIIIWLMTIWFGAHGILSIYVSGLAQQIVFTSAFLSYLILMRFFLKQSDG